MVAYAPMPSDPPAIGADTADSCWLCERGELCHVHAPPSEDDAEPAGLVVNLPEGTEVAP